MRRIARFLVAAGVLSLLVLTGAGCPRDEEDALMLHMYHSYHKEIERATFGTAISPAYMAAIISLESWPPGNPDSRRFEPEIYERLLQARQGVRPYGRMGPSLLRRYDDAGLKQLATSFGLTQIMGYHCLDLGCDVKDLHSEHHLQWAVAWMHRRYEAYARRGDWEACFRIHNTGRPNGRTTRLDYAQRGVVRMAYYNEWIERRGKVF